MPLADINKDERSFERLKSLGVLAREQVLLMLPNGYTDYRKFESALPTSGFPTERACYWLEVVSRPNKKGIAPVCVTFNVTDGKVSARLSAFGIESIWMSMEVGKKIPIECSVDIWDGKLQIKNPVLIPYDRNGRLQPTYRGKKSSDRTKSVSPDFVFNKTRDALRDHLGDTAEFVLSFFPGLDESTLLKRSGIVFESIADMLKAIHEPASPAEAERGLASAHALAAFEVVYGAERRKVRKPTPQSVIQVRTERVRHYISRFPHEMTAHQLQAIDEIVCDLVRPYPMNRLLSGDVGYGKTDAYLIPAMAARDAGAKVVIMAPTGLIVEQIVKKIRDYDPNMPVQIVIGNTKIDAELLKQNPMMVGTTGLISRLDKLKWKSNLVIIDEQQKMGQSQKDKLIHSTTNVLEATATCQPKTAAMVNFNGMDESILNICPVQKRIITRIAGIDNRARLFDHLNKVVNSSDKAQIAIVYPDVKSNDPRKGVVAATPFWESKFPGMVGVLHGKMKDEEKSAIIKKVLDGEIRILLCTTLIETGLTLPSLSAMVVMNADRFGVSTLHQLRGRLARHGGTGYFFMYLPDDVEDETLARLNLLVEHADGFVLAEKDAEMRGYGSMDDESTGQSGSSKSAMFIGLSLMPKDIEMALSLNPVVTAENHPCIDIDAPVFA